MVIGVAISLVATSTVVFYISMTFIGIAQGFFMPAVFGIVGRLSGPASTFASSVLGVGFGLGMYMMSIVLLPLCQQFFGGGFGFPAMKMATIILALVCVGFYVASKFIDQGQLDAKPAAPGVQGA